MDQQLSRVAADVSPARIARTEPLGSTLFLRWLGTFVDLPVLAILVFGPSIVGLIDSVAIWALPLSHVFSLVLVLAYYPVTEGLWGRSLGKLVSGMIVVDRQGVVPGVPKAIVRTLFRLVEVNPILFGGIPAGAVVAMTPDRQRLGDLVAGTYVVPLARLKEAQEKAQSVVF